MKRMNSHAASLFWAVVGIARAQPPHQLIGLHGKLGLGRGGGAAPKLRSRP